MSDSATAKRLEQPNKKGRIYNGEIDFWKLIFSYMIVIFHGRLLSNDLADAYFTSGQLAVEFFFIVSGYFMMQSADSAAKKYDGVEGHSIWKENLEFIWRKIKAILPYHIFAFVMFFAVWAYYYILQDAPTAWEFFSKTLESIWSLLLMYQSGVKYNHINDILWYISAMLFVMFVLYPIIRKFRKGFCTYGMPIIAFVLLGYISSVFVRLDNPHDYSVYLTKGVVRAFLDIIIGCIVYQIVQAVAQRKASKAVSVVLAGLELVLYGTVIAICNLNQKYDKSIFDPALDYVCLLFLAIAAGIMFSKKSIISKLFKSSWFKVLGVLSVSLYFNHAWVRMIFTNSNYDISYKKQLLVFTVLSTVIAVFCLTFLNTIKKSKEDKKVKKIPYAIVSIVLAVCFVGGMMSVNAYNDSKRPATIEKAQTQYSKLLDERNYMMQSLGGAEKKNPDSIDAMKSAYNKGERFFQTSVNLTSDGKLVLAKGWKKSDYKDRYGIGKYNKNKPVPGYKTFMSWELPGGAKTASYSDLAEYMLEDATDAFVLINTNDISYEKTKEIFTKIVNANVNNEKILSHLIPQAQNRDMLKAIKEAHNFSQINYLVKGDDLKDLDKTLEYLKENGVTSIRIKAKDFTGKAVEKINETDFDCYVYTVNDKTTAEKAIRMGAGLVGTNTLRQK